MESMAAKFVKLYDETEVSEKLKVKRSTLRIWRMRGQGPRFVQLGKRIIRYREDDLLAYIQSIDPSSKIGA